MDVLNTTKYIKRDMAETKLNDCRCIDYKDARLILSTLYGEIDEVKQELAGRVKEHLQENQNILIEYARELESYQNDLETLAKKIENTSYC